MATVKQKARNAKVINRLEKQLKSGVHNIVTEHTQKFDVPLEEKDINRINKELSILRTRI